MSGGRISFGARSRLDSKILMDNNMVKRSILQEGLKKIEIEDKTLFENYFQNLKIRLSEYSFSQLFIWRNAADIRWKIIDRCLCIFARDNSRTFLVVPPIGQGNFKSVLTEAFLICQALDREYLPKIPPYIEATSSEFLPLLDNRFEAIPTWGDYIYETRKLIDLPGNALKEKRHWTNKFSKSYSVKTELLSSKHISKCKELLKRWEENKKLGPNQDEDAILKMRGEIFANIEALENIEKLNITGIALYANENLVGFGIGELLTSDTCNYLIEKADPKYPGSAQFLCNQFCKICIPNITWCNMSSDWGIVNLAIKKKRYHPAFMLPKWIVRPFQK